MEKPGILDDIFKNCVTLTKCVGNVPDFLVPLETTAASRPCISMKSDSGCYTESVVSSTIGQTSITFKRRDSLFICNQILDIYIGYKAKCTPPAPLD